MKSTQSAAVSLCSASLRCADVPSADDDEVCVLVSALSASTAFFANNSAKSNNSSTI